MLASTTSKWGLNREVRGALFRVRTGPECPEDNLRDLTSDINPKLWDSQRERKKKKKRTGERENFPVKSSTLRHCWAAR